MHQECIIWRFEIAVFSVIGPCNLNGQHRRFGLDLLLQSSDGLCRQTQNAPPKHSLPCMYQTIRCPDSDHLVNPHHCQHTSNPIPKIIQKWNIDGNVTLQKLNYTRAVYIFTEYLISHTVSTYCEHCYILHLKKLRKQIIFNINTHFWSGLHMLNCKLLPQLYHKET